MYISEFIMHVFVTQTIYCNKATKLNNKVREYIINSLIYVSTTIIYWINKCCADVY